MPCLTRYVSYEHCAGRREQTITQISWILNKHFTSSYNELYIHCNIYVKCALFVVNLRIVCYVYTIITSLVQYQLIFRSVYLKYKYPLLKHNMYVNYIQTRPSECNELSWLTSLNYNRLRQLQIEPKMCSFFQLSEWNGELMYMEYYNWILLEYAQTLHYVDGIVIVHKCVKGYFM